MTIKTTVKTSMRLSLKWGFLLCAFGTNILKAEVTPTLPGTQPSVPENGAIPSSTPWLETPEPGTFYLVMRKQTNQLTVHSFKEPTKILKEYRAITGTNIGDKEKEGDKKTPEGIYFIDKRVNRSRMTALHGAAAFELNYPNPVDRIKGRTGSGIWIHGVDRDDRMKKRFDTLGCVAVANNDIVDLAKHITTLRNIPIVIVNEETAGLPLGVEPAGGPFIEKVKSWAQAWSSRDASAYLSFYHPDFYSTAMRMKYDAWVQYKTRLTKQYSSIQVDLEDVKVLRHGKYSVAIFKQIYRSSGFQSVSMKRLYWIGEPAEAQILAEEVAQELPVKDDQVTLSGAVSQAPATR